MKRVFCGAILVMAFQAAAQADWSPVGDHIKTRWAKEVSPTNALPEYPRPQMVRKDWLNLNGLWDLTLTPSEVATPPTDFADKILVPYPYESSLSGIGKPSPTRQTLWYRRNFDIPTDWTGKRLLLHFGAVNWSAKIWLNGQPIGEHKGGYDAFDFDVTSSVKPGTNEIMVAATNPLLHDTANGQALGKQRANSGGVLYTASSGIWQTVWLEPVPVAHVEGLKITPDIDNSKLEVSIDPAAATSGDLHVVVKEGDKQVADVTGPAAGPLSIPIPNPQLWSPDHPFLYNLTIDLLVDKQVTDSVQSYAGLRKISLGKDAAGHTVIMLNNQFLFEVGCLDQGYWPDGLYTAPTDEALHYDIEMAKKFHFNLMRKHAKTEPDRWYYWTDKLGVLVWQDMPQMFGIGKDFTDETKQQWLVEWTRIINQYINHPSIIVWTCFNEDWGQHDTEEIALQTKKLDPTRLVNPASGGYNVYHDGKRSQYREDTPAGIGDIQDEHDYPFAPHVKPDDTRAAATGEFGGIAMTVKGHDWTNKIFGYGQTFNGSWFMTRRYQELLKKAWSVSQETGSSAIVYTQIVDVEEEINGLLTYDREVVKPIEDIVIAANDGKFPEMPANPNALVAPTSETTPVDWKYTLEKPGNDWNTEGFNADGWQTAPAPFGAGYPIIGTPWKSDDIWLRREFTVGDSIPQSLAVILKDDDKAEVFINGVPAADVRDVHGDYFLEQVRAPAVEALKTGTNILAVHCHQTSGGQIIDVGLTEDDK